MSVHWVLEFNPHFGENSKRFKHRFWQGDKTAMLLPNGPFSSNVETGFVSGKPGCQKCNQLCAMIQTLRIKQPSSGYDKPLKTSGISVGAQWQTLVRAEASRVASICVLCTRQVSPLPVAFTVEQEGLCSRSMVWFCTSQLQAGLIKH